MQHEDEDDRARHHHLLKQRFLQRVDSLCDDIGPIIEGYHLHFRHAPVRERLLRQAGLQLLDLLLQPLDDLQRILAVAHHHDAADGLCAALVEGTATELRPDGHVCHMPDLDRRTFVLAYDDFLQILDCLDESDAADEELNTVLLQHFRADIDVRPPYGVIDVDKRDPVGSQLVGMNVDLVLPHETADAGDLADTFDGIELVAKIPILDGPQLGEVESFPLDGVPIDLTQRRGVRPEYGRYAAG